MPDFARSPSPDPVTSPLRPGPGAPATQGRRTRTLDLRPPRTKITKPDHKITLRPLRKIEANATAAALPGEHLLKPIPAADQAGQRHPQEASSTSNSTGGRSIDGVGTRIAQRLLPLPATIRHNRAADATRRLKWRPHSDVGALDADEIGTAGPCRGTYPVHRSCADPICSQWSKDLTPFPWLESKLEAVRSSFAPGARPSPSNVGIGEIDNQQLVDQLC